MRRIIHTNRLALRPITLNDAPAFSRLAGEFEIARMTGSIPSPFPLLSAEIRTMMFSSAWRQGQEYSYAITMDQTELMGVTSLFKRKISDGFELGYWIGRPFWGNGYMTEACAAIISAAEDDLGLDVITAGVFADNPGSIRVLQKLGFISTGQIDDYFSIARLQKAKSLGFVRRKYGQGLRREQRPAI